MLHLASHKAKSRTNCGEVIHVALGNQDSPRLKPIATNTLMPSVAVREVTLGRNRYGCWGHLGKEWGWEFIEEGPHWSPSVGLKRRLIRGTVFAGEGSLIALVFSQRLVG